MFKFICKSNVLPTIKTAFIASVKLRSNTVILRKSRLGEQQVEFIKWLLLAVPVTTLGLGSWQVYRLKWKLGLIEMMQNKTNAEPVELPKDLSEIQNMEYMPVRIRGEFLHDREILIGPRALIVHDKNASSGSLMSNPKYNQGWLVITPFRLSGSNKIILVNRGWIPKDICNREKRPNSLVKGTIELTGVVRLTEKRPPLVPKNNPASGQWLYRDLEQLGEYAGSSPIWVDARGMSDPPEGWPIPNQTRVTLRNEHLSYIVTWYSLSAITGYMWHRIFIRRLPLR